MNEIAQYSDDTTKLLPYSRQRPWRVTNPVHLTNLFRLAHTHVPRGLSFMENAYDHISKKIFLTIYLALRHKKQAQLLKVMLIVV